MVGRVLTGNGFTRDSERDALLQLCRQRLDGQRGEEVACLSVEKPAASAIAPASAARSAVRRRSGCSPGHGAAVSAAAPGFCSANPASAGLKRGGVGLGVESCGG
jgi:hypothetical protein